MAFADMMKKQIVMPAHLMDDGIHTTRGSGNSIFEDFEKVAAATETYTTADYVDIIEYLLKRWKVETIKCTSEDGQRAQDYVCKLPNRLRRLMERAEKRMKKGNKKEVQAPKQAKKARGESGEEDEEGKQEGSAVQLGLRQTSLCVASLCSLLDCRQFVTNP